MKCFYSEITLFKELVLDMNFCKQSVYSWYLLVILHGSYINVTDNVMSVLCISNCAVADEFYQ